MMKLEMTDEMTRIGTSSLCDLRRRVAARGHSPLPRRLRCAKSLIAFNSGLLDACVELPHGWLHVLTRPTTHLNNIVSQTRCFLQVILRYHDLKAMINLLSVNILLELT
ncbi:unnamed protein product [Euphydryas editha]|uniref:Uncharacterized protein n=1 Tax=Euphydryas editha TaxID=104508 RepID=A0AAU9UYE5_EUPED|nr:unnamed protein product [Euphydryas editha]